MHARIEGAKVVEYPIINLRQHLPEVSLPVDLSNDAALPQGFVYVGAGPIPEYNQRTHKLVPQARPVQLESGRWVSGYNVLPLSAEELAERNYVQATEVRAARNQKLADCDWTQVADATVDKAAWAMYRQALRDISKQPGFPWSVEWPVAP